MLFVQKSVQIMLNGEIKTLNIEKQTYRMFDKIINDLDLNKKIKSLNYISFYMKF